LTLPFLAFPAGLADLEFEPPVLVIGLVAFMGLVDLGLGYCL
jgi:hypothetical protein